jgi:HK97 gp10 family phage protein
MTVTVTVTGLDAVRQALGVTMDREGKRLSRQVVKDVAQAIADRAKERMPVDTGTMRAATKAVTGRDQNGQPRANVVVGRDAYYWRFLEYGDGPDGVEHAMFLKGREAAMSQEFDLIAESFKKRLAAAMKRKGG